MSIISGNFGKTPDGEQAGLFTLTNKAGLRAKITNYGGIVVSLEVPDKDGRFDDVVLGFDNLEQYFTNDPAANINIRPRTNLPLNNTN